MNRKLKISSGNAAAYGIAGIGNGRTAAEDQLIADALALLDNRLRRGPALTDPDEAGRYCKLRLAGADREIFLVLFLDTRHRLVEAVEMFKGTNDGAEVHPREVVRAALACNAAAIICAHNHPSGNPEASAADRAVTARLKQALALVEVRLLDHFIVGDGAPTSMARRGWV
jgi:DNA repair protein RadC